MFSSSWQSLPLESQKLRHISIPSYSPNPQLWPVLRVILYLKMSRLAPIHFKIIAARSNLLLRSVYTTRPFRLASSSSTNKSPYSPEAKVAPPSSFIETRSLNLTGRGKRSGKGCIPSSRRAQTQAEDNGRARRGAEAETRRDFRRGRCGGVGARGRTAGGNEEKCEE